MFSNPTSHGKWAAVLCAALVLLVVAIVYWPVAQAHFVYDDILDFQRMAWLRHGDAWQHFMLRKFNDWTNYFRPLGIALFTLEVRMFDVKPGPMHLVSLVIHLLNTLLVGVLAGQISKPFTSSRHLWISLAPMLFYGLHPLLVEPVVWIGCQFELTATLFMLLGWIANASIVRPLLRAAGVSVCFFLAACSKESAAAFPFILVLLDWFACSTSRDQGKFAQIRELVARNWTTYTAIFVTGIAYLALRRWSLGELIPSNGTHALPLWAHLQEVAFLYLRYWRILFLPTVGMGPLHIIPTEPFFHFNASNLLNGIAALAIMLVGVVLTLRRHHVGGLILCITLALLPVLHIVGVTFDASLYHERYAMTALALGSAWLPSVLSDIPFPKDVRRTAIFAGAASFALWIALAVVTVRVTAQLWSDQVKLWQWALEENPGYMDAKDELISGYIDQGSYAAAWKLIDDIVKNNERCMNCLLNAANLSINEGSPERASLFLQKIKDLPELYASTHSYRFYLTMVSQTELLQGNFKAAEEAARAAIASDHLDPQPQLTLAIALAFQGQLDRAEQIERAAIPLLTPDEQPIQREKFKRLLESLRAHSTKSN